MTFNVDEFMKRVLELHIEHHFNPYTDICPLHDAPGSPQVRTENLRAYLNALQKSPIETAWIGRDFGYRGGRRTGLPLTDEAHLSLFRGTYKTTPLSKATQTGEAREVTANEVWRILPEFSPPPLLWNVVPLHPHKPGVSMSNTLYSPIAAQHGRHLLSVLLNYFQPKLVLALGRDAAQELASLGIAAVYIRHPSHAGQAAFKAGITNHMNKWRVHKYHD